MTRYRRDPVTDQLAQWLPIQADVHTGAALPDTGRWLVLYFQPGSGISVRLLDDTEVEAWQPVEVVPL